VQELLGHKKLALTMKIYAKVKSSPKRQAISKLSYAHGVTSPEHLLPMPSAAV
jgi:integrase